MNADKGTTRHMVRLIYPEQRGWRILEHAILNGFVLTNGGVRREGDTQVYDLLQYEATFMK